MDSFRERVYKIVAQIPEGRVATYGQIAALCGNPLAARAVGMIMRNTPEYLNIPCHRVVNQSGRLAPDHVFGGKRIQRVLLIEEGIPFKGNGCIDMKKCLWNYSHEK